MAPAGLSTASGAGIQMSEPATALQGVAVRVARDATGAPVVPQGVVPVGAIYQFGPVGSFAAGSEISVPFDASALLTGQEPRLYFTMPQADGTLAWAVLAGATREGDTLRATVHGARLRVRRLRSCPGRPGHRP